MKKFKFLSVALFLVALFVGSCSAQKVVSYQVKTVKDVDLVIDSIMDSGTAVSPLTSVRLTMDDGSTVTRQVGTLYRGGEAKGSIQILDLDTIFEIKIIDAFSKKEIENKKKEDSK